KQQLTNDIQASFTNALDAYYLNQEKENTISIYSKGDLEVLNLKNIINQLKISDQRIKGVDSLVISKAKKSLEIYKGKPIQTQAYTQSDSSGEDAKISTSIVISVSKDSLKIDSLNAYIDEQLDIKDIKVKYAYVFHDKADDILQKYHPDLIDSTNLHTVSKSAYLPDDTVFTIYFTDAASTILKRNLLGMILSFVLVGGVVACLFWLLTIIKKQKQLAELKNDLISNITHEFKT